MYVVVLPIAIQLSETARAFPHTLASWYSGNNLALYSESLRFESRVRHRLICLSFFHDFLEFLNENRNITSIRAHPPFFSPPHSPVLPFDDISSWYGVVNNRQRKSSSHCVPIVHHDEGRMDWCNISLSFHFIRFMQRTCDDSFCWIYVSHCGDNQECGSQRARRFGGACPLRLQGGKENQA